MLEHSWDIAKEQNLGKDDTTNPEELAEYMQNKYSELGVNIRRYDSKSENILTDIVGNLTEGYTVIVRVNDKPLSPGHAVAVTGYFGANQFFGSSPKCFYKLCHVH